LYLTERTYERRSGARTQLKRDYERGGFVGRIGSLEDRGLSGGGDREVGRKQKAEGRKQKAESRKQKAESRKQKAEGRKQKAESRRQKAVRAIEQLWQARTCLD